MTSHANVGALANSTVLVTGGLGFIGSRLALRLVNAGARVTIVDTLVPNSGANVFHREQIGESARISDADLRDTSAMLELVRDVDHIVNLAALTSHADSMQEPLEDMSVNVGGQISLLEACRFAGKSPRIVHASTRQVYGKPTRLPVDELHATNPPDVNAVHKLAGEFHHALYARVYGIQSTILRFTNVFGPGMRIQDARQNFLGVWIRAMIERTPIEVWGGEQVRDMLHVDDAVDAMIAVMSNAHDENLFNVGGDDPLTLRALAQECEHLDGGSPFKILPYPNSRAALEIGSFVTDSSRFRRTFKWEPAVSLRNGLQSTLDYYREHFARYVEKA